ncbi:cytochrome P450 4c3-like [Amblyomma americanum]
MEPIPAVYRPLLPSKIVTAFISVAAIGVAYYCVRKVARWIRVYASLRNAPRPKESLPFCLILDMWRQISTMDSSLEVPARLFNYFKTIFSEVLDHDLTVAYYGPKPFLVAVTPNTVERVLSNSENVNKSFLYAMLKSWVGNGLLTSEKTIWKKRRKVLTPAFHFRILDEYVPIMNRRASVLCEKLAVLGRDHFDLLPVMRLATFGILFETAMGITLDEEDVKKTGFLKVNDEIATDIITRMMNIHHWPEFIYRRTGVGQRYYQKVELIKKYTRDILDCRKKSYKIEGERAVQKKSFMDILLRMHMEEGVFTEEEIREEVNTFMIGGFDTTATAASFAIHLLGNHPETLAKVHEELDAVFGSDRERPVTVEDIKQLKYLDCVLKEALRLYPPIPAIARKLGEDVSIGKYTIPKGTVSVIFIYFMHRHPRFFPKPNDFIPERFLEVDQDRHPFLYIPFAGGARNCIGQKFAQLEDKILLAQILRRFKVKSKIRNEDLQMSLELVLRPSQGLHLKLTPRDHAVT